MITLRQFLAAQYDWTGITSKILSSTAWHAGALALVGGLVLLLIFLYHLLWLRLAFSDLATVPIGLEHMFPAMTHFELAALFLPLLLLLSRVFRIWRFTMGGEGRPRVPLAAYAGGVWTYVQHSMTHSLVRKCADSRWWFGHWVLALGTMMMLMIKTIDLRWFQTDQVYPLYHPQRWLGYLATAFILYGLLNLFVRRMRDQGKNLQQDSGFKDLAFPILLLLTALSGMAVHMLRCAGMERATLAAYTLHLVVVTPMLVIEMSFGKWSHMIYRPLALYFYGLREKADRRQPAPAQEALGHVI